MRFLADGPVLPSDLVSARDEGRVVFFCGAGVSLARAGLPDFGGLAQRVVERLRPTSNGPAQRVLDALLSQQPIPGVGGLIATDRVFGLLEREFTVADVREAVAQSLRPKPRADLSCHRTILDLSRGPDEIVRLVTTNFDRLFEKAEPSARMSAPPGLPDPRRGKAFNGIVHLHGCVTRNYRGAQDDEFVLSSGDFGRAYLADGWATSFIQSLMKEYQLIFVGYAADDPPMHYLLEALSRSPSQRAGLYAFQAGTPDEATALWAHKGVEPIAYDSADGHSALWRTLDAWAERARDIDGWTRRLLDSATEGPRAMDPVGRGQVAQLLSTASGANKFAQAIPPGEWLCVMDSSARYGQPSRPTDERPRFDPFESYCLDDDPPPPPEDLEKPYMDRGIPSEAWDAFSPTRTDREALSDRQIARARGVGALVQPDLPPRLWHIGRWIAAVSGEPIVPWWAAGCGGLHPDIQNWITRSLATRRTETESAADSAWRFILQAWCRPEIVPESGWFELEAEIEKQGWSKERIRRWAQVAAPRLRVRRPWFSSSPLEVDRPPSLKNILDVELVYPNAKPRPDVPDELLTRFARTQLQLLETSAELEFEISGWEVYNLPPIEQDPSVHGDDNFHRTHGIAGFVFDAIGTLDRLRESDPGAWRREVRSWTATGTVFSRLRIWAAGKPQFSAGEAARLLLSLSRSEFWGSRNQRDLLLTLRRRWAEFPASLRGRLESRLRQGPARWAHESRSEYKERRATEILRRTGWMRNEGLSLSFGDQELDHWRADAPRWRDEYSSSAAQSLEGRSGWVGRDTGTRGLEQEPLRTLLAKAEELSGHDFTAFVDIRPLDGLAERRPVRFLRALELAERRGEFSRGAWETFLSSDRRVRDSSRFQITIGLRLSRLPLECLAQISTAVSDWMLRLAESLSRVAPTVFDALWHRLIEAMRADPESAQSNAIGSNIDWATHSLNSPVGRLAQALMKDVRRKPRRGRLPRAWLRKVEELLALEGNAHRDALVIFAYQLPRIYYREPEWTEDNILCNLLSDNSEDSRALWAGFFWAARVPNPKLYKRIKPHLLRLAESLEEQSMSRQQLAGILLAGWGSEIDGVRVVTDEEMRTVLLTGGESFRQQVLWQLGRWCEEVPDRWASQTVTLLRNVWPRQSSIRTSTISDYLVDVALQNQSAFRETVRAVIPLLVPITQKSLGLFRLRESLKGDLDSLLDLLVAALPRDAGTWPYGADQVVEMLAQKPQIARDSRLVELRRRLAAG